MSRRWVISIVVLVAVLVAAAAVVLATRDDDSSDAGSPVRPQTTSSATSSSSTTLPSGTTLPATSTTTAPNPAATTTTSVPDPCAAQGGSIRAALDDAIVGVRESADMDSCRLAAVDPSWAVVHLVARPGQTFDALTVLMHSSGTSWAIVGSGTSNVGCNSAPQQVLADLGIICASRGGA
jgi:hypothetical protein